MDQERIIKHNGKTYRYKIMPVDKIKLEQKYLELLDDNYKLKLIAQQLIFKKIPEADIDSFFNGLIRGEYNLLLTYLSGLDEPITSLEE